MSWTLCIFSVFPPMFGQNSRQVLQFLFDVWAGNVWWHVIHYHKYSSMPCRHAEVESSWKLFVDRAVGSVEDRRNATESERGCRESSLAQANVTVHRKENFSCVCLFDSHTEKETAGPDSRCLCPTESYVWLSGW